MRLSCGYVNAVRTHLLSRFSFFKSNPLLTGDSFYWKNIFSTTLIAYKPLHTAWKLERALTCHAKCVHGKGNYLSSDDYLVMEESFDQRNKTVDSINNSYLTVINIADLKKTSDLYGYDEFVSMQEFRNALSKSWFHYDVRLVNHHAIEQSISLEKCTALNCYHSLNEHLCLDKSFLVNNNSVILAEDVKCSKNGDMDQSGRPSQEQLLSVIDHLNYWLLHFFEKPHNFSIYHKNIVFYNNIKGVIIRGISSYIKQMYLLKLYGRLNYAKVKVEILKVTHHTEDGTVRVRWRVSGVARSKIIFLLLKLKKQSWTQILEEESEWIDGFSVFSIGQDGLIYKHVCDKMMPDDEELLAKQNSLKNRILMLLGLSQRPPSVSDINAMLAYSTQQSSEAFLSSTKTK